MTSIYVDGKNLAGHGYVGSLGWSHQWPGGCWDASWTMAGLSRTAASRLLVRNAEVRVYEGTWPVWRGYIDETGDGQGSFTARGHYRQAEEFLALDLVTGPVSNTETAINDAIADGWDVTAPNSPPAGVASEEPQYVHQLLDTAATAAGQRWGVDAFGRVYFAADPTEPSLIVTPGQPLMGTADDDFVTKIKAGFVAAVSGTPPVPSDIDYVETADIAEPHGRAEVYVDLTPRGLITATEAQNIVNGMLSKAGGRVGFTSPLTLGWHQLLTTGGTPANPATVAAGRMVRVYGAINPDGTAVAGGTVDIVVGATAYEAASRQITLSPVGMVPRTLSDVLAVTPVERAVA